VTAGELPRTEGSGTNGSADTVPSSGTYVAGVRRALQFPGAHSASEDSGAAMFLLSAFGMLGVVHSSESGADFATLDLKSNAAGFSHAWSNEIDGRAGGQIYASFTRNWSAVVQVISEQKFDNPYTPHVELTNINYQITLDLIVRFGWNPLPNFLVTEQRKVGYANTWVRRPLEIYKLAAVSGNDGVDVTYKRHIGAVTQSLIGTYALASATQPDDGTDKARRSWVVADSVEYGAVTAHVNLQTDRYNAWMTPLALALDSAPTAQRTSRI
jgi:hypothetical protein